MVTFGLTLTGESRTISSVRYGRHEAYGQEFFKGPQKYFKPGIMLLALIYEKNTAKL